MTNQIVIEPGPAIVDVAVLDDVKRSLDGIMPDEFKEFLLAVNGGELREHSCLTEGVPVEVVDRFALERFFSIGAESEWNDLVKGHRRFRALYPTLTDWACIASTPGGDFVLIDSAGRVASLLAYVGVDVLSDSFLGFLRGLVPIELDDADLAGAVCWVNPAFADVHERILAEHRRNSERVRNWRRYPEDIS